jgi:hypothetical protein
VVVEVRVRCLLEGRALLTLSCALLLNACGAESTLDTPSTDAALGRPESSLDAEAESDKPHASLLAPLDVRLDLTFGSGGQLSGDLALWAATGVGVDAEGRVLVSGSMHGPSPPVEVVRRFSAAGILDGTFGGSGQASFSVSAELWGQAIRSFSDGTVGVLGAATIEGGHGSFLIHFAQDGSQDPQFGAEPVIATNGGQFLTGLWENDGSGFIFGTDGVVRFDSQGRLGPTGNLPAAAAGAFGADGTLLTGAGSTVRSYLATGAPDPSFGRSGAASLSLGSGAAESLTISSLLVEPSGDVVVVGSHPSNGSYDIDVTCLSASGSLDATFAGGAFVSAPSDGSAIGSAYLPDGRIIAWTSNGDLIAATPTGTLAGPWSLQVPGTILDATLDASQRLLVVGMATDDPMNQRWFVRRYLLL